MSDLQTPSAVGRWRPSRRRLLQATPVAAAGLALTACRSKPAASGGSAQSNPARASTTPRRGGTLTIGTNFRLGFDPHVMPTTEVSIEGMFYSTIIRADPKTNELEPDLAAKWEAPSQTEVVFTLAPSIKWHDKPPANGRAFKVDDIIYSLQRVQSSDPRFINKSYISGIDKMEAVDDHTLKLTLKQPDVTQLSNLSVPPLKILAPEVVDKAGKFATADTAVGTGAFVLQRSDLDVSSSLTRNPAYFKPDLPHLDRIEARAFKDYGSEWAAFLAGQIDHRWVPGQDSKQFADTQKSKYALDWFPDQGYQIMQAMVQRKPFDDARVSRSLRLITDHDEWNSFLEEWFGRGRYSSIFAAATAEAWDLSEDEYRKYLEWKQPKDDAIKEALSLLSAAGYTKDKPLKFTISGTSAIDYQRAMVQLLQAQFKRNGQGVIDCDIKLYDTAEWNTVRANSTFEYFVAGHNPGGVDPDAYFTSTFKTGGGRNYGKMSDPVLDKMFEQQRTIFDEKQRKQAVRDIIIYMIDHCPYGGVDARYVLNADRLNVRGFPAEGAGNQFGEHYENVWLQS
ncbi:MAG TPA: ABC transporter substrate-binding protein [Dehalococcoidia bacterium]|nr:ABC transporter substrate-binding protein [Dehalococcoidia bacterium]